MAGENFAYMTTSDSNVYGGGWIRDSTLVNNLRQIGCNIRFYSTFCNVFSDDTVKCDGVYFKLRDVLLAHNIPKYYDLPAFPEFENPLKNMPYLGNFNLGKINMDTFNLEHFSKKVQNNIDFFALQLVPRDVKQKKEFEILMSMERGIDGKLKREVVSFANRIKRDRIELLNVCSLHWSRVSSDIKNLTGIVDVATIQGYDMIYSFYKEDYRKEIESILHENVEGVDSFIGVSKYYSQKASSDLGIPLKKINVIYNGVDVEKYRPVTVNKDNCFTITYLGRIDTKKGVINLVLAVKHLVDEGYGNFKINIVGSIDRRDSAYINVVKAYISLFKMDKLFDLEYNITLKEKVELFNKSDVIVYPTAFPEPFGLVPVEAMACGTPVVVPDHGAFPEIIKETKGGLLFRPNDSYDLAKKIIVLMEDKNKLKELSENGLRNVKEKFGAKLMAERALEVYENLLN